MKWSRKQSQSGRASLPFRIATRAWPPEIDRRVHSPKIHTIPAAAAGLWCSDNFVFGRRYSFGGTSFAPLRIRQFSFGQRPSSRRSGCAEEAREVGLRRELSGLPQSRSESRRGARAGGVRGLDGAPRSPGAAVGISRRLRAKAGHEVNVCAAASVLGHGRPGSLSRGVDLEMPFLRQRLPKARRR